MTSTIAMSPDGGLTLVRNSTMRLRSIRIKTATWDDRLFTDWFNWMRSRGARLHYFYPSCILTETCGYDVEWP